ncbi:nitric oxide-associated protein 1-like isoform X2 [Branchiostoma lanceolatum]|uniref:nitric oxide-associated protein 1-like isoform X2 n=1 Tax=Branchiostoma lanceolatum TaxID=7740 RepID=UPI0034555B29
MMMMMSRSIRPGKHRAAHVLRTSCQDTAVWRIPGRWRCSSSQPSDDINEGLKKAQAMKTTNPQKEFTSVGFKEADEGLKSVDDDFDIHSTDSSNIEHLREHISYQDSRSEDIVYDFSEEIDDKVKRDTFQTEPVFHSKEEKARYILSKARQLGNDMTKHIRRKQELQEDYLNCIKDPHASHDNQHELNTFSDSLDEELESIQLSSTTSMADIELKKSYGSIGERYRDSAGTEVKEDTTFQETNNVSEYVATNVEDNESDDMSYTEEEEGIESYRDIIDETLPEDLRFLDIGRPREVIQELKKGRASRKKSHRIVGEADPEVPPSTVPCQGCGAYLQCCDGMKPGFLPSVKFKTLSEDELRGVKCQRCVLLTNHKIALDVQVSRDHYVEVLSPLKDKKNALVILMVDLLDFPCSIFPNLLDLVGKDKWLLVVGNKFDLLPPDGSSYKRRTEDQLFMACLRAGLHDNKNIKHVCLISAKTGYGVEQLITEIQTSWGYRGDVYLMGNTNVGKSTLFNRLLESDFCQQKAEEVFQRATISQWPGTTMNLLRFPMVNPTRKARLSVRKKRLWDRNKLLRSKPTKQMEQMERKAYVVGHVGRTDGQQLYEEETERELSFSTSLRKLSGDPEDAWTMAQGDMFNQQPQEAEERAKSPSNLTQAFEGGKWVCDTPGYINDQQILNLLTSEELERVVPSRPIIPRTVVLRPEHTLFLAALGRVDYVEGLNSIFLTVFASGALPLHVCTLERADDLYARHAGKIDLLKVPLGGAERMESFPPLQPAEVTVTGVDHKFSAVDLVLSSAGWVAVTPDKWTTAQLRVYTPGGLGFHLRPKSLLPNAVNFKGKRINASSCRAFYRPIAIQRVKEISRKYR